MYRLENDLFSIKSLIKHYAGRHDQRTHGHRYGTVAGKPHVLVQDYKGVQKDLLTPGVVIVAPI